MLIFQFIQFRVVFSSFTQDWIYARQSALLPLCLPGIMKLNSKVHAYIRSTFRDSIDTASSILVIILLILLVIFASVFCAVEIYSETITVVQLGSDVVNYTINHRPELINMFPEGKIEIEKNKYIFTFHAIAMCSTMATPTGLITFLLQEWSIHLIM